MTLWRIDGANRPPQALGPDLVYVLDGYPELSQTFVTNEITELRRQGVDVRVVALHQGDATSLNVEPDFILRQSGVRLSWVVMARSVIRHPRQALAVCLAARRQQWAYTRVTLAALPRLLAWMNEVGSPRRVHTHFAWGVSAVATYVGGLAASPVSLTVHARDIYVYPADLQRKFDAMDVVVTVCDYNRTWLSDRGYRIPHLEVVPCGVELPNDVKQALPYRVVGVGRLVPKKGFDLLVRAAERVRVVFPELRVTIIGDGPEFASLSRLIDELDLGSVVELAGPRPHEQVLESISEAQLFVLPCRVDADGDSDALPVVLREAMARAVGVVSTRIAGIPETINEAVGWLVDPDDVAGLAAAMIHALSDPEELARRSMAARTLVAERYTLTECVSLLREVFARQF